MLGFPRHEDELSGFYLRVQGLGFGVSGFRV